MKELIKVEGLNKSFRLPSGELKVLKDVEAFFYEGEMVSIVGASGTGKSTFLHVLGTLDKPTSGKITYRVKGQVSRVKEDESLDIDPFALSNGDIALFRNKVIGFVFQFHYLLPEFSAIENVMMPGLISSETFR
jgi:lipoprotein-releasing system ATP-binding protein